MTQRGSANSMMAFLRSFGMTVGIMVFGIIQRNVFTGNLAAQFGGTGQSPQGGALEDPRTLLSPEARPQIPAPVLEKITAALSTSIAHTFMWGLIPAGLTLVFILMMGNERPVTSSMAPQPSGAH